MNTIDYAKRRSLNKKILIGIVGLIVLTLIATCSGGKDSAPAPVAAPASTTQSPPSPTFDAEAAKKAAAKERAAKNRVAKERADRIAKKKAKRRAAARQRAREARENVYYANCTEARKAGAAPIQRGEPGYGSHLDRDGDGTACDT